MSDFIPSGLGWQRDLPDRRDFSPSHELVAGLIGDLESRNTRTRRVDLRTYCPGADDQRDLPASTAHACVGLIRYFERRATGRVIEPSRMFVYKTARLLQPAAAGPLELRTTWKAILRFGVPPEQVVPFDMGQLDREPEAYTYSFVREFLSIRYVRLDSRGESGPKVLDTIKSFLAAGFACTFGFAACTCLTREADIPFPTMHDTVRGGQAVMAVGYDDNHRIRSDKGALLIRNSWGQDWGDEGYGWLPYTYIREQLAADFWTLVKPEWLESGEFRQPV